MPGRTNVEVDPIRCWWRTSAGAVRIGEHFDLWLTCAVLETDAVQVVPDESHLGIEVAALAPFEVVGGSHPADLRSGNRRFFQYQYILRIINPDAIGKDVKIPDTVIHYKVNSRVAANTSLQGRDLTYVLPPEEVRVASMVPADATDIRDSIRRELLARRLTRSPGGRARDRRDYVRGARIADADLRARPTGAARATAHAGRRAAASDPEPRRRGDPRTGRRATRPASRKGGTKGLPRARSPRRGSRGATALGRPVSQRIAGSPHSNGAGRIASRARVPREGAHACRVP